MLFSTDLAANDEAAANVLDHFQCLISTIHTIALQIPVVICSTALGHLIWVIGVHKSGWTSIVRGQFVKPHHGHSDFFSCSLSQKAQTQK